MSGCQLSVVDATTAMDGELIGEAVVFSGVSIDTRTLEQGELFFAIAGPNFDGHEYVEEAKNRGAIAVVVERKVETTLPQIVVKSSHDALGVLAALWRLSLKPPVIAITGSNGKTSVKEMLFSIMSEQGNTFATKGNLNNDLGVPLSLLSIDASHAAIIIEMGANHPKEIEYLARLARPNISLVNNAAAAHLEGFGDLDGVANAKGEIYQGLCLGGYGIVNNDDHYADMWKGLLSHFDVVTFAIENEADVRGSWNVVADGVHIEFKTKAGDFSCDLHLSGKHNVMNALAATSVAIAANVPVDLIKQGLEKVRSVPGRLEMKIGCHGSKIIDDTYNANPTSTHAALAVLENYSGKKCFVLGDMGELGDDAQTLHAEIGEKAKSLGIDYFYGIGELSKSAVKAFGDGAKHFDAYHELVGQIKSQMNNKLTVLVKGSRSMQMNKVVSACMASNESVSDAGGEI